MEAPAEPSMCRTLHLQLLASLVHRDHLNLHALSGTVLQANGTPLVFVGAQELGVHELSSLNSLPCEQFVVARRNCPERKLVGLIHSGHSIVAELASSFSLWNQDHDYIAAGAVRNRPIHPR